MMATTVINIRAAPPGWRSNPLYVYIGRPSKWGNPFVIGKDGTRDDVCDKHEEYVIHDAALLADVRSLRDKILVCYCHPKRCHGDLLALLADV
jgi:hypothetical protein